jgi:hypothetical protein
MTEEEPAQTTMLLCGHCNTRSISNIIATEPWIETIEEESGKKHFGLEYRYRLVRCAACYDLSLLLAEKVGWLDDEEVFADDTPVYPAPPRSLGPAVPKILEACFQEARACYQVRAYTATAIMCRRALELLANARGVNQPNLAKSLAKLKDQGDIDQRLYDWCDALRLAGNKAAHDVEQGISQIDAKDMSDLVEAIIDYVYVYQARYEDFQRRRGLG